MFELLNTPLYCVSVPIPDLYGPRPVGYVDMCPSIIDVMYTVFVAIPMWLYTVVTNNMPQSIDHYYDEYGDCEYGNCESYIEIVRMFGYTFILLIPILCFYVFMIHIIIKCLYKLFVASNVFFAQILVNIRIFK